MRPAIGLGSARTTLMHGAARGAETVRSVAIPLRNARKVPMLLFACICTYRHGSLR